MKKFGWKKNGVLAFGTSLTLVLGFCFSSVSAQPVTGEVGVVIVSSKANPLPLYANPGDTNPVPDISISSFPLEVMEVQGDFLRVNVKGRTFWVDAMNVRTNRKTVAKCAPVITGGSKVAGELGAASDRCK